MPDSTLCDLSHETTPAVQPAFFSSWPAGWWLALALASGVLFPFSTLTALLLLPGVLLATRHAAAIPRGWPSWLLVGWLMWLPLSLIWSLSPGLSLNHLGGLLCLPLAWLLGTQHREGLDPLLERLIPGLLLILALWGWHQGPETYTAKPHGPFNDPNTYAAVLNLLALPILASYLRLDPAASSTYRRTAMLALLGSTAFVYFLVSSRGATLAFILVLTWLLWHARRQPAFLRKLGLLVFIAAVAYVAARAVTMPVWGGNVVLQRLVNTAAQGDQARLDLFYSAWLMIRDHPWLGMGLGSFRLLYGQYRMPSEVGTAGGWVHNDYLQLWQEAGLPMLGLLIGLVCWVVYSGWVTMRQRPDDLTRLGYIAALAAILLHANVNFLLYFPVIGLLLGLYLARAGVYPVQETTGLYNQGAGRLAMRGFAFILGYLLAGQLAVQVLLDESHHARRIATGLGLPYSKYEIAFWLTVIAPFHPTPQMVMAKETADASLFGGDPDDVMRQDALRRYAEAFRLAPCYLPISNAYFELLTRDGTSKRDANLDMMGKAMACNPRHGVTHYYAGMLVDETPEALAIWHASLRNARHLVERIMLAAAILSRTVPEHRDELSSLARDMAKAINSMEANPMLKPDQKFWTEAQYKLLAWGGSKYLQLITPPRPPG